MVRLLSILFFSFCTALFIGGFMLTQLLGGPLATGEASPLALFVPELGSSIERSSQGVVLGETADTKDDRFSVLFDSNFLQIQESNLSRPLPYAGMQEEVSFYPVLLPPQDILFYPSKTGAVVTITWKQVEDPLTRIKINRSFTIFDVGEELATVPGTSLGYHDKDVMVGEVYYYTLMSIDRERNESTPAGPYQVGPLIDTVAPPPPTFGSKQITEQGIELSWKDPEDPDVAAITIYRSEEKGMLGVQIAEVKAGVLRYEDTFIEKGKTYYYLLKSKDVVGNESNAPLFLPNVGNSDPFTSPF